MHHTDIEPLVNKTTTGQQEAVLQLHRQAVKARLQGHSSKPKIKEDFGPTIGAIGEIRCYRAPYSQGFSPFVNFFASFPPPDDNIPQPGIHNPFGRVDANTGRISLSAICGVYGELYYGNSAKKDFLTSYQESYGSITQKIDFPEAYDIDMLVDIYVQLTIPDQLGAITMNPGSGEPAYLDGLVGCEGDTIIYASYFPDSSGEEEVTGKALYNFMSLWQTSGAYISRNYQTLNNHRYSFILPKKIKTFRIVIMPVISAHCYGPELLSHEEFTLSGTMIDFRDNNPSVDEKIFSYYPYNNDNIPGGPIILEHICVECTPLLSRPVQPI